MPKYTETCERQNQPRSACSHVARGAPYFHFRMWLRKGKYLYSPAVMPREDCSAREMMLLLELQQMDRKNNDSVYLVACAAGMNKYLFWNYLACNTVTKGSGREEDLIKCRPNEILSPDSSSTSDAPTWAYIVLAVLVVAMVTVLLLLGVVGYQCYRYRR